MDDEFDDLLIVSPLQTHVQLHVAGPRSTVAHRGPKTWQELQELTGEYIVQDRFQATLIHTTFGLTHLEFLELVLGGRRLPEAGVY